MNVIPMTEIQKIQEEFRMNDIYSKHPWHEYCGTNSIYQCVAEEGGTCLMTIVDKSTSQVIARLKF